METNPGPAPGPSPPTPGVPWVNPVVVDWLQSNAVRVPVRNVYLHPFSYDIILNKCNPGFWEIWDFLS